MLAVLLASSVLAWTLSVAIRPQLDGERWYLMTVAGQAVGWRVDYNSSWTKEADETSGDDLTTGYQLQSSMTRGGVMRVDYCNWQLSGDQNSGRYIAGSLLYKKVGQGAGQMHGPATVIIFDKPQLTIKRSNVKNPQTKTLQVSDDYIPEGSLQPLIARVAKTRQAVTGKLVIDDYMELFDVQLSATGTDENGNVIVTQIMDAPDWSGHYEYTVVGDEIAAINYLDPKTSQPQMSVCLVSASEVASMFPDAMRVRNAVLDSSDE